MESTVDFKTFGLDPRLMKAIKKMGYTHPTLIQAEAIPLALQGKDILARAKTGSGKTAAYCIPLIHKILRRKDEEASLGGGSGSARGSKLSGLILVPTKELSEQVRAALSKFTYYTYKLITVCNLCSHAINPENTEWSSEVGSSDIVIGTPGTVSKALDLEWLDVSSLEMLVLDEADLLFSFGYQADLEDIAGRMPRICQGMLMSATLTGEVESLKKLVLRTPVVLKLTEPDGADEAEPQITEYTVPVASDKDRFTALYAVLKLNVINGKVIIFVNDVLRCFRLRLFFDRFSIRTSVLNSNLPLVSRLHTIQEFNRGAIQILLAADDSDIIGDGIEPLKDGDDEKTFDDPDEMDEEEDEDEEGEKVNNSKEKSKIKKGKKEIKAKKENVSNTEYSMARGVDFVDVAGVINFDIPNTVDSYVHRIGRTGRGTSSGVAISFFSKREEEMVQEIIEARTAAGHEVKPYEIKNAILGSFRYRTEEVLRKITLGAVKRANESEIKAEILNSEKLRDHFRENPREAFLLRGQLKHAKRCRGVRELKVVPEYMLPPGLGGMTASELIQDVEIGKEDPIDMLGKKRVRHGSGLAHRPKKKMRNSDYIPKVLGGKHSQHKKSDLNAAFKSKRKYGRK